jgi:hypothetical protein
MNKKLENPEDVFFETLLNICKEYFGEPRISGSHHIFKTPWRGDPRANLYEDGIMAKPYQVALVKKAIARFEEMTDGEKGS